MKNNSWNQFKIWFHLHKTVDFTKFLSKNSIQCSGHAQHTSVEKQKLTLTFIGKKIKHEYLRSRASRCLYLSSPSGDRYSNLTTIKMLVLISWILHPGIFVKVTVLQMNLLNWRIKSWFDEILFYESNFFILSARSMRALIHLAFLFFVLQFCKFIICTCHKVSVSTS